ncbi:MAG TPA: asparagine synthase (glutamine-hydrolyzing) [Methylomirabilota bacterium]|jgi:asparagine synthase (glutamine-hydrolysing)|nr:asparagine synthase (glutamine-hydrolyzing) [Methylomirabilota bacterium]
MCGIVGMVQARPDRRPDEVVLKRMADRIAHRGPDDEGFVVRGPVALGIRRLRIIDLETGRQPMTGEDGTIWVVFNGEIYNYRELTTRLTAAGHTFRTRSDTEAIVHAWEMRGPDALNDLEGMFGLAVWNDATQTLVLARDRLGIKPVYYAVLPEGLVFASELKAMLEHPGVSRELDVEALSAYLAHEWVPAPRSIVKSVRKLPPGHRLVYARGEARVERWWDVRYGSDGPVIEVQAAAKLGAALDLSVRQHLLADVPLGVFLSGGLDSATVAAFARRHSTRLNTFSIGFEDASFDESKYARQVAAVLGTEHHEEVLGADAALDLVGGLAELVDEPLGDASILPTFLLSRFARKSVTVALSGDGGDEIFAGYPTYQAHRLAHAWARAPRAARAVARATVRRMPVSHGNLSLDFRLKRFVDGADLDPVTRHAVWMGSFTPHEQGDLLTAAALARLPGPPSYAEWERIAESAPAEPWLHRVLYLDLKGYLGEGVLQKVDRASMACSLEVRVPLLDRRVVEVAAAMPPEMKLRRLTTKHVLKWLMRTRLPKEIVSRPKKGFGVPLARWFRGPLCPLLEEVCEPEALRRAGLVRPETVTRLIHEHQRGEHDHRKKLYTLLVFLLWARRHRVA